MLSPALFPHSKRKSKRSGDFRRMNASRSREMCHAADAEERHRRAARQPQPPHARQLRRHRVRNTEHRSFRASRGAVRQPLRRFAAVHAGAPRRAVRRARFSVEAVGLDRAVGRADHTTTAARRRNDDARHRSSAPLRKWWRELPHRVPRLGVSARPRRRSVEDARRSVRCRCTNAAGRQRSRRAVRPQPHVVQGRTGFSGTAHDVDRGQLAARQRGRPRSLHVVHRRVRSARTVRHTGAVGESLRPRRGAASRSSGRRTPSAQ